MTHPATIWVDLWSWYRAPKVGAPKYIHSDIVTKLKGYAVHDDECPMGQDCTCGLSETLRKLEE